MKVETAQAILEAVKAHVARAVEPLQAKIAELEGALARATAELAEKVAALPVAKDGADGRTPTQEELLALITPLIPAPPAVKDGRDGIDGKDGVDGRDALHLEILPTIEEGKSVPRGTYALHQGGLWRSFETTHGMRGWECIVNGVAAANVEQIDARAAGVFLRLSNGDTVKKEFRFPVVLDKGIYKAGEEYEVGDAVTWNGSLWIKQAREEERPYGHPGEIESGWRLAVKAGRPGRDGKDFTPPESKQVRA